MTLQVFKVLGIIDEQQHTGEEIVPPPRSSPFCMPQPDDERWAMHCAGVKYACFKLEEETL